jgi:hypothetical protein
MKTLITKLSIVFFIAITCASCSIDMFNKVTGDRNVVTENRNLSADFTRIKASNGLDVYITQENKNTVVVEADENLQDIIITEVENGILKIYSEKNIWRAKSKKVYVSIKTLTSLTATSGSDVYSKGTINADEISISATSGADVKINVDAKNVETSTTSGSDIRISGTADNHAAKATSGSSIKAYDLVSKNVIAKVTSGADIDIYASEIIEAKASSGGDIDYKGNPKKVNKKSSSGGSVSKK